jgi:hypothetical protein
MLTKSRDSGGLFAAQSPNASNNWTYSWQIRGRRYGAKYTQVAICGAPGINQSCLFCCDFPTVHTRTRRNFVRQSACETGISWTRVHRLQRARWKMYVLVHSKAVTFLNERTRQSVLICKLLKKTYSRMQNLWRGLLVFVTTPLLPSAAIVEELEQPVWVCCGWRTPPTAHSNQFQLFHDSSR